MLNLPNPGRVPKPGDAVSGNGSGWTVDRVVVGRLGTLARVLDDSLRLTTTLDDLSAGRLNAPEAEARLQRGGRLHHVFDADGVLGLDPLAQVPVRQALARVEHGLPGTGGRPVWALLLPRPGRMAGLRGPVDVNRRALAAGAAVMTHDGAVCWVGDEVGAGIQWRLVRAERPLPPPDPRDAARQLAASLAAATRTLTDLDLVAGQRPGQSHAPVLGKGFDQRAQQLLDRSWLVLEAVDAALEAQADVLHSHAVLVREKHLRALADAALDGISAAASWPADALH